MENLAKTSEEKNAKQHIFVIYQNVLTSIKGNCRKIEKQKTYQATVFFYICLKDTSWIVKVLFSIIYVWDDSKRRSLTKVK
jgi:hypothetical protein